MFDSIGLLWNVCLMFWFWWILQCQYTIHFPTSNVHDLIHPFSPIWDTMQDWIWIITGNSYVFSKAIQWIAWMNPSMQNSQLFLAPGEIVEKRSASRFNRQSVFDVFWCSKVVKSTVFYGDICHLKRRMSLRKNYEGKQQKRLSMMIASFFAIPV